MTTLLRSFFLVIVCFCLTACSSTGKNIPPEQLGQNKDVQVIQQGAKVKLVLSADAFFKPGSPTINPTYYPVLDSIAALLNHYRNAPVTITGYTDNVASPKRNREFSQALANSIVTYLWTKGIPFERMTIQGSGEDDTIATNRTVQGNAMNRRVEIDFWQEPV